jgi:hypothetical protein
MHAVLAQTELQQPLSGNGWAESGFQQSRRLEMADMPKDPAKNPGEAIFNEARCARQTSQELLPLLTLLQDDGGETQSPLDELKGLLTAIIEILGHQNEILTRLDIASGNAPQPSSLKPSTSPN